MGLSEGITGHWIKLVGREPTDPEQLDLLTLVQTNGEARVLTCLSGYLELRPRERPGTVGAQELMAFLSLCADVVL